MIWEINSGADIVAIATHELRAEIAKINGNFQEAANELKKALAIEDQLNYNEPPDWFFSVRHLLGDVYMRMGEFSLAERVYREDLQVFPKNGFALKGLYHSLVSQGKLNEAVDVKEAFEVAWVNADTELKFSRVDEQRRKNLAIRITENSPNNLIYIADSYCVKAGTAE